MACDAEPPQYDWWDPRRAHEWMRDREVDGAEWVRDRAVDGAEWIQDQARRGYEWLTEEPETLDKAFDELEIPEGPQAQDDDRGDDDEDDHDRDREREREREHDDDDTGGEEDDDSSSWEWALFGFGVLLAAWASWEWLGTDPSVTLWEFEIEPIEWTPEEDEDEDDVEDLEVVVLHSVFFAPVPYAARIFDPMLHGGVATPGPGSPDVLVGGLPALRMIDQVVCPVVAPVPHIPGAWMPSQTTVFINGAPALRAGDCVVEVVGGPNPIVAGEPTVMIGPPVPAVVTHTHVAIEPEPAWYEDIDWPIDIRWSKIEFLGTKGKINAGLSQDGPFIAIEAQVDPIHVYGGVDTDFDIVETPVADLNMKTHTEGDIVIGRTDVDARIYVSWLDIPGVLFGRIPPIRGKFDVDVSPIGEPNVEVPEVEFDVVPHD